MLYLKQKESQRLIFAYKVNERTAELRTLDDSSGIGFCVEQLISVIVFLVSYHSSFLLECCGVF